jgi:hypothetical protein
MQRSRDYPRAVAVQVDQYRNNYRLEQLPVYSLLRHSQTLGFPRSYRPWSLFGPIRVAEWALGSGTLLGNEK